MSKYLDKFISSLPAVQGAQVMKLLNDMRIEGTIKTIDEYNQQLQQLTQHLSSTTPKSIFQFFYAQIGELISSNLFNYMVESTTLDLEAAFKEADTISEVLELHKVIYKITTLNALRDAVNKLTKTVDLYEFLNTQKNGWTEALINTFDNTDSYGLIRTKDNIAFFKDIPADEYMNENQSCFVDLVGQCLVMPYDRLIEYTVAKVELVDDADTTISVKDVSNSTLELKNIIDQTQNTFWTYPIWTNEVLNPGARIKLRLDLGNIRRFNMLQVESGACAPLLLESVEYLSAAGETITISIDEIVKSKLGFYLGDLEARFITLQFLQKTYSEIVAEQSKQTIDIFDAVQTNSIPTGTDPERISRIQNEVYNGLPSPTVRNATNVDLDTTKVSNRALEYLFALDNLRIFKTQYQTKGIYISKKLTPQQPPGLIALEVNETNPTVQIGSNTYKQFSFEYNLLRKNYNDFGDIIDYDSLAILPSKIITNNSSGTAGLVENERLHVIYKDTAILNNVAVLRFVPDSSSTPVIYENLTTALTAGSSGSGDYQIKCDGGTWRNTWGAALGDAVNNANKYIPIKVYIKFHDPSPNVIYTITYTASTRMGMSTSSDQRKLSEYIILEDNFATRYSIKRSSDVVKSDLYLSVIIRNNYLSNAITPSLNEYKILWMNYNDSRFQE